MQGKLLAARPQILRVAFPIDLPVSVPNASSLSIYSGNTRTSTVQSFPVVKLAAADVAQGQMGHERIQRRPVGSFLCFASQRFSEKCELKSEFVAVSGSQISGVVPPLSLKIWMIEIIAREFVTVAGEGVAILHRQWSAILDRERRERIDQQHAAHQLHEPIPHAPPRWD